MSKYLARATLLMIGIGLIGCAYAPSTTNLTPALLRFEPSVSTYKDPSANFSSYRTFSVFPASWISEEIKMNEIMEKQLLFFVRNLFEIQGYQFVELNQQPDLLVTLNANSEYKQTYVPPKTVTIPRWVPGRTITSFGSSTGTFNINTYGSYSSRGWGSYTGTSTASTFVPGYLTTQSYTRSGYNVGYHYPIVAITVYDGGTYKNIWTGNGVGTSSNPDVRISSQIVLSKMVAQFPVRPNELISSLGNGVTGMGIGIYTPDGNNYLPTVTQLAEKAPAKQAGVKLYDMILTIDGASLVNQPITEAMRKLAGEPGSTVNVEIWRVDQRIPVTITRVPRKAAY